MFAQLDEQSKSQVKLLAKVQDVVEPFATTVAHVTNEVVRGAETAGDDLAILLAVCKLCDDKAQVMTCLEALIDPGVQPQDPLGQLAPPDEHESDRLKDPQHQCDAAAPPEGTGPHSIRTQVAQLTALGDARVSIHKLTEETLLKSRVKRPSSDVDPAKLAPQDRRSFLSAEFCKAASALPVPTTKRPHGDPQHSPRGRRPAQEGKRTATGASNPGADTPRDGVVAGNTSPNSTGSPVTSSTTDGRAQPRPSQPARPRLRSSNRPSARRKRPSKLSRAAGHPIPQQGSGRGLGQGRF